MNWKCLFGHKWNGCKCEKCGKTRDEQHDLNGCKCKRCGAEKHDWDRNNSDFARMRNSFNTDRASATVMLMSTCKRCGKREMRTG